MIGTDALVAALALPLAVAFGTLAHEGAHALVLRAGGVAYDVAYLPGRAEGVVAALARRPWAAVSPRPTGREPPWLVRLAALAPLALAVPVFGAGAAGLLPADRPVAAAVAIGWLACAIPSPRDFSVAFRAGRLLDEAREAAVRTSRAD